MSIFLSALGVLKNLKLKHAIILIILGLASYTWTLNAEIRKQKIKLNNYEASNDSLKTVFDDGTAAFMRLSFQYENITGDLFDKTNDFETLNDTSRQAIENLRDRVIKEIKDKDEEILVLNSTIFELKEANASGVGRLDIVYTDDNRGQRFQVSFEDEIGPIGVKGFTVTNPPEYSVDAWLNPIAMQIIITETDNEQYQTYLLFSDNSIRLPVSNTYIGLNAVTGTGEGFFGSFFNLPSLYVGYEYHTLKMLKNSPYVRVNLPISKFNLFTKLNQDDVGIFGEIKIWGQK